LYITKKRILKVKQKRLIVNGEIMKKYWMFRVLLIALFIVALSIFYLEAFSKKGFVFLVIVGIIIGVLNFLNNKAYKRR